MKETLKKLLGFLFKKDRVILPGETELDYIPPRVVYKKKKTKKSEFPMPPHNPKKRKTK